jgi:peroxiredoxin
MKRNIFVMLAIFVFTSVSFAGDMPGLKAGEQASDFKALSHRGNMVTLSEKYEEGPVILVFYRGGWCPYCNTQLRELNANMGEFKKYGATVVAVSVDKVQMANATVEKEGLGFEVISNTQGDILENYGLVYKVSDELNAKYKNEYKIDLEAYSGRKDHLIAIPATYIINRQGKIVFAYANEDYKVRTSSQEIIKELKKLNDE